LATEVERGSEAERAGLRAGMRIVSVDGELVASVVARRLGEQSSASVNKSARVSAVARVFEGAADSFAAIVFSEGEAGSAGREKSARLRRTLRARAASMRVRRLPGSTGLVQFNVFTPEMAGELSRAMRNELRGVRALVVDLRDNGGGEAEAMTDIASLFLPAGTKLGRFTDRVGRVQLEPQTRARMLSAADVLTSFRGALVVLTSGRTASASEVFVAALRERGRARIVGESTCGCVLGIRRRHALPDGGVLEISEVDFRTASGARLEGSGLAPDEQVAPTRADLRAGRDGALERALQILKTTAQS
jgi:carboxyl-terminal processing protease